MQTTLLGLAVALILALVAALVGPFVVDWTRYRTAIEAQASRIVGAPVEVSGPIEVRLLPTPSLALQSVAVAAGQRAEFSARSLRFEIALGPLMRGEWRVSELTLGEPRFRIGLDRSGALPPLALPAGLGSDRLAVERLAIVDGRAVLADAESERTLALDGINFTGELRSLAGPLRGDGRFAARGGAYRFRLSAGRGAGNGIKLRLGLDAPDWPLTAETDGVLSLDGERPRFDGTLALSGPAGAVLADGRALARDPWRATAQVRADTSNMSIEGLELSYGPEDRLLRLSGSAAVTLAPVPHFAVTLSGHQMVLDRLVDAPTAGRAPLQALPAILGAVLGGSRPPIPGKLDLAVDQVTFAGSSVQGVQAQALAGEDGWSLHMLEFRAPGATQVRLGGRLRAGQAGVDYAGPVQVESSNPAALLSFVDGSAAAPRAPIGPVSLTAEATVSDRDITMERVRAEIDGRPIEGRIAYAPAAAGRPGRLDATLSAAELDLDSASAIAKGALAGVALEWPRTMALALRISRVTYSGIDAGRVDAKLNLDANGLTIERFAIGDLRGASITATGLVDIGSPSPHGSLSLALTAARADGLAALVSRVAPQAADEINRYSAQLGSADLRARLDIAPGPAEPAEKLTGVGPGSQARLAVDGKLGAMRINLNASAVGRRDALTAATVKVAGSIEAENGRLLAALTGADRLVAIETRPLLLTLSANGPLDGAVACDLRLAAGGLSAAGTGTLRLGAGEWSGRGDLAVTAADARPLLNPAAKAALPVALDGRVAFTGPAFTVETLKGRIAGSNLTGRLALNFSSAVSIDGRIEASDVDAGSVIAVAVNAPRDAAPPRQPAHRATPGREPGAASEAAAPAQDPPVIWPAEPFGAPLFASLRGRVAFAAERAGLLPGLLARHLKGSARFDGPSVTLENLSGSVADGAFTAEAVVQAVPAGLSIEASLSIAKADLAQIDFGRSKPPASGSFSVAAELRGAGRSPATLIGALHGSGRLSLEGAQISGLDPTAIDAAIGAAERGLPLERLTGYLGPALDAGKLAVSAATTTIEIVDGQIRFAPMIVRPAGAEVVLSAAFNLATDMLDAQVTLAGKPRTELQNRRPEVAVALRGPLGAPVRAIEAGALLSYVTLQAVEREAQRVEAAEREAKRRDAIAAARERAERERIERERIERERAAVQRAEEEQRAEQERRARERAEPGGRSQQSATEPAPEGDAGDTRAPALPPPIEIKPQPVKPGVRPVPSPRARPAGAVPSPAPQQPPPRRSFWDELFGGR